MKSVQSYLKNHTYPEIAEQNRKMLMNYRGKDIQPIPVQISQLLKTCKDTAKYHQITDRCDQVYD